MVVSDAVASPSRPRSARYAEKGYPNYAELDARRGPRWRSDGGGRAKKPEVRRGRKRRRGEDVEAAAVGKVQPPILQAEEAVTQEHGRKRRMTDATAADKVFPLIEDGIEDGEEEAASTDERGVGKNWRQRVKETLRMFSTNYLHFVQEEQRREEAGKQDPKASRTIKCQVRFVLCTQWYFLLIMQKGYENFAFPLATCIVLSGKYADDFDKANEIIYTGEGGNNLFGNCQQQTAQTLVRGNLALKNSKDNGNPVRVIRGHVEKSSYSGKVYTYDGLYKVVDYWSEKGVEGHLVFKYRLKRLEGQPPLTTSQVLFTRGDVPMPISELPGLVCGDISNGQENFPIPATNLVDNPPVPPSGFVYSKSLKIPKHINIPVDRIGCNCTGDCSTSDHCLCAKRNGTALPYVSTQRKKAKQNGSKHNNVGRLVEPKAVVYECGTNCTCHCNCVNRTSQQGLNYHLEVFKTESKGWGVRTWDTILPGALICEYTGVLKRTTEVEGLLENNYLFDIDCLQTIKGLDGREQRAGSELHIASLHAEHESEASQAPEYCIDAGSELSYDYGYRLDSVTGANGQIVKLACHCGAAGCRKRLY
nr:unnamed protein product [Digitaria exilis]